MAYVHGNLAEQLDFEPQVQPVEQQDARPQLNVVNGTRTQSRQQADPYLSPLQMTVVKAVAALVVGIVAVCIARVAIISSTYAVMSQNSNLTSQLEEARSLGSELEVQQSVVANSERVRSIATDMYGMVPAGQVVSLDAQTLQDDASQATQTVSE